jgi:hypothetical protein
MSALDFADLVTSTLNDLGPFNAMQQIAQNKQRLEVLSRWMREEKVNIHSGVAIQRQLMVQDNGAARFCEPTADDVVNLTDVLKTMQVPWVHCETSWMVVRQHTLMNRSPAAIVDNVMAQRNAAMLSLHDVVETKVWGTAPSSSNTTDPWGVFYWIVSDTTNTGFYGGSPTGDGKIANINLAGLPNPQSFNNYTDHYSAVTPSDAIPKMRDAHHYTNFVSPVDMKDYTTGAGDDYRVYGNRATVRGFEEVAAAQGDMGIRDIAVVNGFELTFHMNPIRTVSALDGRTDNPIVMINHSVFGFSALEGDYLHEQESPSPNKHNIMRYHVDLTGNFVCTDRRRQAVLVKV